MSTEYNQMSAAVHDLVNSINRKHNRLKDCAEFEYMTNPDENRGMGRVSQPSYLINLKCAVSNSVSRSVEDREVTVKSRSFINGAKIGLELMEDFQRLSLLTAEERNLIDEAEALPFYFSRR
jgi:hypothetical protein